MKSELWLIMIEGKSRTDMRDWKAAISETAGDELR